MSAEGVTTDRTVMFADIVDSTGLYEAVGDARAQETLQRCLDLLEEITQACAGTVEKRIGDEVLCVFDTPADASRAAARMHIQVVGGLDAGLFPRAMRLRIGFEHGEVIERDGELFGSSVHTAARFAALAKAGQTLTSQETFEAMEPRARPMHRPFDRVVLKGQTEPRDVIELLWSHGSTVLSSQVGPVGRPHGGVRSIELSTDAGTVRVDAAGGSATLGRDEICTLRVDGTAVSRLHGKVILERGAARYEDMSSNGSAIEPEDGEPREVRRTTAPLTGRGVLRLGLHCGDEHAAFVRYACYEDGTAD